MKEVLGKKLSGLREPLGKFYARVADFDVNNSNVDSFADLILAQMKELSFDKVSKDKAGNVIGIIKGYGNKDSVVMMSHIDVMSANRQKLENLHERGTAQFKAGIAAGIYTGALVKRALMPLTGDLIVCCVPRVESGDFGIRSLFEGFLKTRTRKVKGVVLCEPTDFNINLGHKGRMEYEIVVRGKMVRNFLENRGINMLGTMFPLISELEKVSRELPSDFNLGRSDLKIKDVRFNGSQPQEEVSEFRIVVDRVFIPEENESYILDKAKTIARNVYKSDSDITVRTALAKERVKTYTGLETLSEKEYKPWLMESHRSFASDSLKSLTESGFKSDFGYWKKIVTDGSYTCAQLKIPTIGFGAGSEDALGAGPDLLGFDKVERAVYGQTLIVQRNIGMPAFGWNADEI
ncbi:MAG: M20/M25/M40 family metallo-hydrolase [Candidatus Omnitrophica bacterium]|nr:M20/M25/M40 family metallo-hydrolase [Candidatus Omnitrophota bacterium]